GISADITDRKQAEEELRRNEEFLRQIIRSSTDCIKVLDLEGRLLYMSAGGQSLLEIDNLSSVINSQWVDFWQETYNQAARSAVETAKAGGTGKFQGYCPTAKGTPKWWEVVVTPLVDAEGKPEKLLSVSRDITDRKRAEEVLRESNQRVINIFESITDAFFALDNEWRFTYLNRQAERLLQRTRSELLGKNLWAEFPEAVDSTFYREYHRAVEEKVSVEFEELYSSLNTWFGVHAYPSKDGLSVYFQDISQRKRAEETLQQTTMLQRAILASANYTIISTSVDGTILTFNAAAERWLGYAAAEVVGKATPAIIHDWDEVVQRSQELSQDLGVTIEPGFEVFVAKARRGEPDEREWSYIRKDGSRFPVLLSVTRLVDAQGNITGFLGIGSDITERKRTEEALRESEARSRRLVESNIIGIIFADTNGNITMANNAFLQMVGYTPEELNSGKMRWDKMTPPEYRHLDEQVIEELRQYRVCSSFEKEYIRKDGSRVPVVVGGALLEGSQDHAVCFVLDITDRKRAEEELQRQNQRSQLFADITLKIRQSLQLDEILQATVTEVQKLLQADRVLIFRLYSNGYGKIINEAVVPGWSSVIDRGITDECFGTEYLKRYIQGRIYTIADIEKAGVEPCLVQFMQQFGVKAKLVMPILLKEELWGLLIVHQCAAPRQWSNFEIELLRQIADQIGIALAQAQLLEEETRQRQELGRSNAELQQ
ncbi:MAG: PAS domain S-box protein, partial [Pyrinomonadaceae bacterium]|nr:PAS domain S-box protein [Pyrinomonadaceae bacterium]